MEVRVLDVSGEVEHARLPVPADLAAAMRAWCARRGVSQSALAMRVGISASHLNQIVHGRARPSLELAQRIAAVLEAAPPRVTIVTLSSPTARSLE